MAMRPLVAAAFLLLAGVAAADSAEDVRRIDLEVAVATWAGDGEWFEENLADDYLLISPTGVARTKTDVIRELATPGLKMEPYEPSEVQVRVYGDSAVVNSRVAQKFTLGTAKYSTDLRYTNVYTRRKGRWLLVSGHASRVATRR
jgi:hypothetical protein